MFLQLNTKAQNTCTLACLDNLTVALSQDGSAQIWTLDFLEASCEGELKLTVIDEDETVIFEQQDADFWTINQNDVGNTYTYTIEHTATENICWGNIYITDKLAEVDTTGTNGGSDGGPVNCPDTALDFTSFTLESQLEFSGKTIEEINTEVFISYFIAWENMLLANNVDPNNSQSIAGFGYNDAVDELDNGDIIVTRTFELIDWCHFIPHDANNDIYTFTQTITIKDLGPMLVSEINFAESTASISINKMKLKNETGQSALVQLETDASIGNAISKTIEAQGWETSSFQLEVEKYESCAEGISSIDLVQVLRHILDIEAFDSNIKKKAADIDENLQITAADLVKMRGIILGLDNCNNDSNWRFYKSELSSDNAFDLNNSADYTLNYSTETEDLNVDIVALKKGDVNLSILDGDSEFRSLKDLIVVENQKIKTGQIYDVEFKANEDIDIISGSINFENSPFEILGFSSKSLNIKDSNYSISKKKSSVIFYQENPISINSGDELLSLRFKASKDGTLEDIIKSTMIDFDMYSSVNSRNPIHVGIEFENSIVQNENEVLYTAVMSQGKLNIFPVNQTDSKILALSVFTMDGKHVHSLRDINVNDISIELPNHQTQLLAFRLVTDKGYNQTGRFFVQ